MDTLNSSAENGKRTKKKRFKNEKKKTRFGNTSQEIRVIETDVSVHFKVT